MKHPELDRIHTDGFCHFIHHVFPGPFAFLLLVTARCTGLERIGLVVVSDGFPVRNLRSVQHEMASGASQPGHSCTLCNAGREIHLMHEGNDSAIFLGANPKPRYVLRLHLHEGKFLILRQHQADGPACLF